MTEAWVAFSEFVENLAYSGGGFVAGILFAAAYAKAQGHALKAPWTHDQRSQQRIR